MLVAATHMFVNSMQTSSLQGSSSGASSLYEQALLNNPFHAALHSHHTQFMINNPKRKLAISSIMPPDQIASGSNTCPIASISHVNSLTASPTVSSVTNSFSVMNIESMNTSWIIDSSAIDHIVNSLHWFTDFKVVNDMFVSLLDLGRNRHTDWTGGPDLLCINL